MPLFTGGGKDDITVRQLLIHYSGLPADFDLSKAWHGREAALEELWRMKEAAESPDLFQAVLLDPLFAKIGTGRLKSRLRHCPLWQVRASAAAALGLRGEERIEEALAEARRDSDARVREAARRVLAQLHGPLDLGRLLRQLARGTYEPLGAAARPGGF